MFINIDTSSGIPIYLQIMNGIKYAIAMGSLKPGDQVPSVRELSAQLRINPNTVLKAVRELEHQDILTIKRGLGAFVTNAESSITEKEREKIIRELLSKAISQSIHFKISDKKMHQIFEDELSKFKKSG
ncbi:MAG: hypothetical protein A2161_00390 [Candidatus Schekmanbacteria bacterium RBG_13_48_7]|uniref:HTH gntR-type domain-containing protein n=1 Tax=Candidatus Schekmanbacteria bacterium RBG_13_48_7 TaxID=1817878 RepID=A0A1F7S7I1_9BACT|nr:MAG: hypothetical protein A2161_00390 [Candidatus Schekmanbacteria bacterium RBG_13_48_7]